MGILLGAGTFSRYRVEVPEGFNTKAVLTKGLRGRGFRPLDRREQDDRACGFVELEDHDATGFGVGELFYGDHALFTFRVDEFRITASAVRKELERWKKAFEKENLRPPGRRERVDAKHEIRHTMRRTAEIVTRTFDVSWNLSTQRLDIWAASERVLDEVVDAITQAFDVKLVRLAPAMMALDAGIPESNLVPTPALAHSNRTAVTLDGEAWDSGVVERQTATVQFLRGKAFLGREFLTWLLWRSESGEPLLTIEGAPLAVVFADRLVVRGIAGDVVEGQVRGAMSPYSSNVRFDLARGLLVHLARLRLMHGERVFEATVDAERLDPRSAKLPGLLSEEEDEQLQERLFLAEQLASHLRALLEKFLRIRASRSWLNDVVPEMKAWMGSARQEVA